jgi:hypothetical protein
LLTRVHRPSQELPTRWGFNGSGFLIFLTARTRSVSFQKKIEASPKTKEAGGAVAPFPQNQKAKGPRVKEISAT